MSHVVGSRHVGQITQTFGHTHNSPNVLLPIRDKKLAALALVVSILVDLW